MSNYTVRFTLYDKLDSFLLDAIRGGGSTWVFIPMDGIIHWAEHKLQGSWSRGAYSLEIVQPLNWSKREVRRAGQGSSLANCEDVSNPCNNKTCIFSRVTVFITFMIIRSCRPHTSLWLAINLFSLAFNTNFSVMYMYIFTHIQH